MAHIRNLKKCTTFYTVSATKARAAASRGRAARFRPHALDPLSRLGTHPVFHLSDGRSAGFLDMETHWLTTNHYSEICDSVRELMGDGVSFDKPPH